MESEPDEDRAERVKALRARQNRVFHYAYVVAGFPLASPIVVWMLLGIMRERRRLGIKADGRLVKATAFALAGFAIFMWVVVLLTLLFWPD
jgi:hypothetical protein